MRIRSVAAVALVIALAVLCSSCATVTHAADPSPLPLILTADQFGVSPFNNLNPFEHHDKINSLTQYNVALKRRAFMRDLPSVMKFFPGPGKFLPPPGSYYALLQSHERSKRTKHSKHVSAKSQSSNPQDGGGVSIYYLRDRYGRSPYNVVDPLNPAAPVADSRAELMDKRRRDLMENPGYSYQPMSLPSPGGFMGMGMGMLEQYASVRIRGGGNSSPLFTAEICTNCEFI